MSAEALPLIVVLAAATYFQTVTGFGLGMIVMGATSGMNLLPVATVAAIVSLVTLANSAVALPGRMHGIDWRAARAATLGSLPAIVGGVLLLEYLSSAAAGVLQLILGIVIVQGSVGFALRPVQLDERSSDISFAASGFFSGLSGGLFGVAGPPLIFQFYRQPMDPVAVRNILLLLFTITSAARSLYLGVQGRLDAEIWTLFAVAVPVVALATAIGRRYPPPLATRTMRRVVFMLLMAIGAYLVMSALPAIVPIS
ncbi:sulfite exporter TauE/SafE family protein [Aromatoleum toluolicum]|uniref:Probable membrane transporter protein n=1 Tax=Aromatoleum toluolicum TaxID=90060 RepID=A0ABX1NA00_9RHOO|nr:sulfite exporter TauE/SafE family protein [Aromatoleum toluolicum]NMF96064.1 sulfite exporter TauE/SafE family protein [Aromatoleum toluolicum]